MSNIGFCLLLAVPGVRLLHALAVGAELAGVHAAVRLAVRLLHALRGLCPGAPGDPRLRRARRARRARRQLLLGLPDAVQPLLLVEGVIGLERVSLALGSIFEADSKEVFD